MKKLSETPRTDAELRKPENDTGIYNNLTEFCQKLEQENEELRKDKERLDWLIDNASISMLRKDEEGEEWWVELSYNEGREDIDTSMAL